MLGWFATNTLPRVAAPKNENQYMAANVNIVVGCH